MISPQTHNQLAAPAPGEIQENKRNGYGYWMFSPTPSAPLNETLAEVSNYGDFTEMPEIISALEETGAVVVNGAPGSGKSHVVRDIQTACVLNNIPAFCLSMHVNAGSRQGAENIVPILEEFRDKVKETGGGLVILDNVDIVGYRGKSKSRSRVTEYAQSIQPIVQELIDDPNLVVLGTAHDNDWREHRWTWEDEAIDAPAKAILEAFPTHLEFEGRMALVGLAHILYARSLSRKEDEPPISIGQAAQVIRLLHRTNRANFFHSNHLPVNLFLEDPNAAIAQIDAGRNERRGKSVN